MVPQPPANHPVRGPIARQAQVNEVPQSGSTAFISLIAHAQRNIGMKARITISGAATPPTAITTKPSVAARLYAGAVDASPTPTLAQKPIAPLFRPFSCTVVGAHRVSHRQSSLVTSLSLRSWLRRSAVEP